MKGMKIGTETRYLSMLQKYCTGQTMGAIAKEFDTSERTVILGIKLLRKKYGAKSTAQLIYKLTKEGKI